MNEQNTIKNVTSNVNLNKMEALIKEAYQKVDPIRDKDIVLIIGLTGAGKTTLIDYLLGKEMLRTKGRITSKTKANDNRNETESNTLFAEGHSKEDLGISYCDTPGFLETRTLEDRICTSVSLELAVKLARSIRGVIVVIEAPTLTTVRGELFRKLSEVLSILFKDPSNVYSSVQFVFTKIDKVTDYVIDLNNDKKEIKKSIIGTIEEHYNTILKKIDEINSRYQTSSMRKIVEAIEKKFSNSPKDKNSKKQYEADKNEVEQLVKEIMIVKLMMTISENIIVSDFLDRGETRNDMIDRLFNSSEVKSDQFNFENHYSKERRKFDEFLGEISAKFSHLMAIKENFPAIKDGLENEIKDLLKKISDSGESIRNLETKIHETRPDIENQTEEVKAISDKLIENEKTIKQLELKKEQLLLVKKQTDIQNKTDANIKNNSDAILLAIDTIMGKNNYQLTIDAQQEYEKAKKVVLENIDELGKTIGKEKEEIKDKERNRDKNQVNIEDCKNRITLKENRIRDINESLNTLKIEREALDTKDLIAAWSDNIIEKRSFWGFFSKTEHVFKYENNFPLADEPNNPKLVCLDGGDFKITKKPYKDEKNNLWKCEATYKSQMGRHGSAIITATAYKRDIPGNANRITAISNQESNLNKEKTALESAIQDITNDEKAALESANKRINQKIDELGKSITNNENKIKTHKESLIKKENDYGKNKFKPADTLDSSITLVDQQINTLKETNEGLHDQIKLKNTNIEKMLGLLQSALTELATSKAILKESSLKLNPLEKERNQLLDQIKETEDELINKRGIYDIVANILATIHENTRDGTFDAFMKKYINLLETKTNYSDTGTYTTNNNNVVTNLQNKPKNLLQQIESGIKLRHVEHKESQHEEKKPSGFSEVEEKIQEKQKHINNAIRALHKNLNPDDEQNWEDDLDNNNQNKLLESVQKVKKATDTLTEEANFVQQQRLQGLNNNANQNAAASPSEAVATTSSDYSQSSLIASFRQKDMNYSSTDSSNNPLGTLDEGNSANQENNSTNPNVQRFGQ